MKLPDKEELANKVLEYPVLGSLVRLVLYEPLFRWALLGVLLFLPLLALFVLRIWTVSPRGFTPIIKVSVLGLMQAQSLKKSALKAMAGKHYEEALYSWQISVANNPAEPELLRGYLKTILESSGPQKRAATAVAYSRWLLRLTRTNLADLELSVGLYEKCGLDDLTIYSLALEERLLSPELAGAYLKALFRRGHLSQFAAQWDRLNRSGMQIQNPELALYYAAWLAGWGPPAESTGARRELDLAKKDPQRCVLAHRLQLKVSEQLAQADVYRDSLKFLKDLRQDALSDHIAFWALLGTVGRKAEAVELLHSNVDPPATSEEAVLLARACFDLELTDESVEVLRRHAPGFSDSEAIWLTYAALLIHQRCWAEVRALALQLRRDTNPLRDILAGYSYYLEGLAELKQQRGPNAETAFQKILEHPFEDKILALSTAEHLEQLGYPQIAQRLLLQLQQAIPDAPEYWFLLAKTAFESNDPERLVSALGSAYKLRPDDPLIMNNYAAALLATRQRPAEAIQLTFRLLGRSPESAGCRINHALALVQNHRTTEARDLLAMIDPRHLTASEAAGYYLASFEVQLNQRRYDLAWQSSDRIEPRYLLRTESQWLSQARASMPSR